MGELEQGQELGPAEPPGRLSVGITYNLKKNINTDVPDAEAEFDDPSTIYAIRDALEEYGCDVVLLEADLSLPVRLLADKPDIVFNIAEGTEGRGREAHVPALLSYMQIPYTGSDETVMCMAMDKSLAKRLLSLHKITTPKFKVYKPSKPISTKGLKFPAIIKPNAEGSGKGINEYSIVSNAAELRSTLTHVMDLYKQEFIVEEYIDGREITVGVLGNGDDARVLPPMEIIFRNGGQSIYSYEVKRNFKDYVDYRCPPDISGGAMSKLMETAGRIYRILGCRDCARMDFRMGPDGRAYFIEINPLPGLAPGYSDLTILAGFCGISYNELIITILNNALARYGMRQIRI